MLLDFDSEPRKLFILFVFDAIDDKLFVVPLVFLSDAEVVETGGDMLFEDLRVFVLLEDNEWELKENLEVEKEFDPVVFDEEPVKFFFTMSVVSLELRRGMNSVEVLFVIEGVDAVLLRLTVPDPAVVIVLDLASFFTGA